MTFLLLLSRPGVTYLHCGSPMDWDALRGGPMSALILAVAVAATIAVPALLIRLTGGTDVIFAEHDLPRPTTRCAPKEG